MEEAHLVLLDDGELHPVREHVVIFKASFHGKEVTPCMGTALRAEAESQRRVLEPFEVLLVQDSTSPIVVFLKQSDLYHGLLTKLMPKRRTVIYQLIDLAKIHHENVSWSNVIINSPISYNLLERRAMYFLSAEVKHKFVEKGLGVPDNWKELYFYLKDNDLGIIGGKKNVPRTYEVLCSLGKKFIPIVKTTSDGRIMEGKAHWVDAFFYNLEEDHYVVRISPEIMPYLINLTQDFTSFDIGTAMKLRSKYSQKMYELCCKYGGDFRYSTPITKAQGVLFKKRVMPITLDDFRKIFNLEEIKDTRTGKVKKASSFRNFNSIRCNILELAQNELLWMYQNQASDYWFDFQAGPKAGRGGKVQSVFIYIYSRSHPKEGSLQPWQEGDLPLDPYETEKQEHREKRTPAQKLHSNVWYGLEHQEEVVYRLLSRYLTKNEVAYYMMKICEQARRFKDSYTQVIQVIQEKESQKKFMNGQNNTKGITLWIMSYGRISRITVGRLSRQQVERIGLNKWICLDSTYIFKC